MIPRPPQQSDARMVVDGKFFRLGAQKYYLKGVTYGPFAPNAAHEMFPDPARTRQDFEIIRELGANLLRLYYPPPSWFLDLAHQYALQLLVDIPWSKHLCFLDSSAPRKQARAAVRQAVAASRGHPALFGFSVANEIPADIVRWSGVKRVEAFLDELVEIAKTEDPQALCTFTNYPSSEFLLPRRVDFVCFNVYLHERGDFEKYLARLQTLADTKPLVLAEFGMDSLREGEARKGAFLAHQIEAGFRGGLAGAVVFSFTDDWFRGGMQIQDWAFGLTTRDRQPKASFRTVQRAFHAAPYFNLDRYPKVSVVVATYNGERTLKDCLHSLSQLNYPDYEIILVDDGSTDQTPAIARTFPKVRILSQTNQGLSAARNAGINAATGEIVAFTDSDCRVDEDWLYYLVGDLTRNGFSGIGGHNLLPADDSPVAAAVMVSPGGPAHVMLTDREAEHLPGCNMAFYQRALEDIGSFDPVFHAAGDDVDVCWRLRQHGHKLGFSPSGFVWHYRRSTVRAYLRQQAGYGEAEALLKHKHPNHFNQVGRIVWRGQIYAASRLGVILERSMIYHGAFGSGFFQRLYASNPSYALMLTTSLEYHVLVNGSLLVLSLVFPALWPLALTSFFTSLFTAVAAAVQANLAANKQRYWSRLLVTLLFLLQPVYRGLARYRTRLRFRPASRALTSATASTRIRLVQDPCEILDYWSPGNVDRFQLIAALHERLQREKWQVQADVGWTDHDLDIAASLCCRLRLTTVAEQLEHGQMNLRCRLENYWSLPAQAAFWGIFGIELVVASRLASWFPWIWMILLSLPVLNVLLQHDGSQQRRVLGSLIDEVAEQLRLKKIPAPRSGKLPKP